MKPYPIFETIFTMYRRKFVRGVPTGSMAGFALRKVVSRGRQFLTRPQTP